MIVIIDYGMGNSGSIKNMIKKVGGESIISSDPEDIRAAEKLVLPGVGNFDRAMQNIGELGLTEVIDRSVQEDGKPILGICLGMQLMTQSSEEGNKDGFGWFSAETRRFDKARFNETLRIPHMGWNNVRLCKPSRVMSDAAFEELRYYFVHTFAVASRDDSEVLCETQYGHEFVSGLERDNIIGVQFHPEKSHSFGMDLFRRFLSL